MKIAPAAPFSPALLTEVNPSPAPALEGFGDLLSQSVKEVQQLQKDADRQVAANAAEGTGDLHEVMLAMEKAGLALKLLVQCRNKLVAAYEELNRITV